MIAPRGVLVVALLLLASCVEEGSDGEGGAFDLGGMVPAPTIELTRSGGCGDVLLWAADDRGSVAVTVLVDLGERSSEEPTTVTATLPDDVVEVEVLHGDDVPRNLCTDDLSPSAEPTSSSPATEGQVEITVDPVAEGRDGCGRTAAMFRIDGLVADDGSTFASIEGTTDQIGCLPG